MVEQERERKPGQQGLDQQQGPRQARPGRPLHDTQFYAERLDRVLALIDARLAQPLALAELAACAAFSPFHFHRVFLDWFGETPQAYIRRARLQRAAALLRYAPERAIAQIALQSGFTSAEAFVRAFRAYFDMTPSSWRGKAQAVVAQPDALPGLQPQQVEIRQLPACRIAYQRKIGPYGLDEPALWQSLAKLLAPYDLRHAIAYGIGLDDPAVTPAARCRFDACVEIPPDMVMSVRVPLKQLEGGLHAVLPYQGQGGAQEHWQWLIQSWLPPSRFSVNEQPCFERYPHGIPLDGSAVGSELCLPLRKRPRMSNPPRSK
jgi:AraC family transcriptional regulator